MLVAAQALQGDCNADPRIMKRLLDAFRHGEWLVNRTSQFDPRYCLFNQAEG